MAKPLALIIQSSDVATTSISKVAESRDCSIHISRSIEEAGQALAAYPSDQLKYVFVDLALCQGPGWKEFTEQLRQSPDRMALICYDPNHVQTLYGLLGPGQQEPIRSERAPLYHCATHDRRHAAIS